MFGWRFDFPELAIVVLAALVYLMMHSLFLAVVVFAIGMALVALYRT